MSAKNDKRANNTSDKKSDKENKKKSEQPLRESLKEKKRGSSAGESSSKKSNIPESSSRKSSSTKSDAKGSRSHKSQKGKSKSEKSSSQKSSFTNGANDDTKSKEGVHKNSSSSQDKDDKNKQTKKEQEKKEQKEQEKCSEAEETPTDNEKQDSTQKIKDLQEEVERLDSKLKGVLADYQNLRKEMDKRLDFERNMIRTDLLKSVIELADDIDVAIDHVEDEKGWREGITMILEKFRKTMKDMGAEIIKCKPGDKFDSKVHEAVGIAKEGDNGTIHKVVQNGYRVGDVVIRPARVIVNKISTNNKNE
jgi:molecular chaperone GrpE